MTEWKPARSQYYKRVVAPAARRSIPRAGVIATGAVLSATLLAQTPTPPVPAPASAAASSWSSAWSRTVDAPGSPRLAVGRSLIFLVGAEAGLTAYSPTDGARVWEAKLTSSLPPVTISDTVAVLTPTALVALDQQTGERRWQAAIDALPEQPWLHVSQDLIVATTGLDGTTLRAWTTDGREAWRANLQQAITTPLAAAGALFFVGTRAPAVTAIDAATGAIRWQVPLPAQPTSLIADGDRLFLAASDGALYSLRQTGDRKPAWRYRLLEAIGQPVAGERVVYFTLIDNTVRALDRNGGSQRWSRELPSRPAAGPLLVGADLLVPLTTGRVSHLLARDGALAPPPKTEVATARLRLLAVAAQSDDQAVYTLAAAGDDSRVLTSWRLIRP
jgi:outer membrane protein assembly factor BamB